MEPVGLAFAAVGLVGDLVSAYDRLDQLINDLATFYDTISDVRVRLEAVSWTGRGEIS